MSSTYIKVLVIRAFLVLLITLSLAACGTSGISDPTAHGTSNSTLRAGSYGRVMETQSKIHKVTIVRVTDDAQSTEAAPDGANEKKYWTAKIVLENIGPDEIIPGQLELRTADDTVYNPITVTGLTEPFTTSALPRNAKATATFVFEIPQVARPKSVRYLPDPSQESAIVFTA